MPLRIDTVELEKHLSADAVANIRDWLEKPKYAEYHSEIEQQINAGQWQDLESAFFKVLEFGTAGRRGMVGVGSNRINRVTIGESAQALCAYAKTFDNGAPQKGVVIACDTRLSSPELSAYVARVCAANGFKTYLFDGFRSTPELSFALRELGCAIGIVISASHNPPADNGFKAYWNDGGQLLAPHDTGVLSAAAAIERIAVVEFDKAVTDGRIVMIGQDIDDKYVTAVVGEAVGEAREINIVYSPLHGAGQRNTLPVLKAAGFSGVSTVDAQMVPDGNFPTIENGKPNPEEKSANDLAVAQLLATKADIAITNDPDADRIGVVVREDDEAVYLNGNQTAVLATDYALRKMRSRGKLTSRHYIAKTIVTTDMLDALAASYDVNIYGNMLIGFKYIGELIRKKEATDEVFVIGSEESYGLLKGTYARDKDGAVGALALAEYAAELKLEGKTLRDRLFELYADHGVYAEYLTTMICPGASGFQQMQAIMQRLREEAPKTIGKHVVSAVADYRTLERRTVEGDVSSIDCVSGDVIVLEFGGDSRCRVTVRPSGTEPKLKFYVQWYEAAEEDVTAQYERMQRHLESMASELEGVLAVS